jgi:hypothetical protein
MRESDIDKQGLACHDRPRYLAFDIETAELPRWGHERGRRHPVGITCAATLASDESDPRLWHGVCPDGTPAPRMSVADARQLVDYLSSKTRDGYRVLTWNGLDFDFQVLAEESSELSACRTLAWSHVDMMFHVFCVQGFRISLDKTAQGMGLPGKPEGMSGILAPKLWAEGCHRQVLDYVGQDARTTLQLAEACEKCRALRWITATGKLRRMPLAGGWLRVEEAVKLPEPDTSWMDHPAPREELLTWLGDLPLV